MPVKNNNVAVGLPDSAAFQQGRSNADADSPFEQDFGLPWPTDSAASYMYYDCTVIALLDSGIVVHNRLPQVDNAPDTLASAVIDDPNLDRVQGPGVNLNSKDQYTDLVQRMAHSRYWFNLRGQAFRVGARVPIPALKSIGGVPAIPHDREPQFAYNRIFPGGNFGGVILWYAAWSLWYTTAVPPVSTSQPIPAVDLAAHISGVVPPPASIQAPHSTADDNAQATTLQPKLPGAAPTRRR